MKKVISIRLGNKMFQIEEDAYTYLNKALGGQWKKQELETQVSERLDRKLGGDKTEINYPDVVDVLYQLGFPVADYDSQWASIREKRLYRQTRNKMLGGVCTGIAEYFEIDPVVMRVLFVAALFLGSLGFWLYIVLWIIVPASPAKNISSF